MNSKDFTKLYHEHYGLLYFWLLNKTRNKEKAEDLASTAFMKAWSERRTLKDPSKLKSWLYQIAFNELRQSWREAVMAPLDEEMRDPKDFTEKLARDQVTTKMVHAMPRLLEQFARGQSVKQLAREHRTPIGTILSRLHSARKETQRRLTYEMSNV